MATIKNLAGHWSIKPEMPPKTPAFLDIPPEQTRSSPERLTSNPKG